MEDKNILYARCHISNTSEIFQQIPPFVRNDSIFIKVRGGKSVAPFKIHKSKTHLFSATLFPPSPKMDELSFRTSAKAGGGIC